VAYPQKFPDSTSRLSLLNRKAKNKIKNEDDLEKEGKINIFIYFELILPITLSLSCCGIFCCV